MFSETFEIQIIGVLRRDREGSLNCELLFAQRNSRRRLRTPEYLVTFLLLSDRKMVKKKDLMPFFSFFVFSPSSRNALFVENARHFTH